MDRTDSERETDANYGFPRADCPENPTHGAVFWGNRLEPFINKEHSGFHAERLLEDVPQA